VKRLALLCLFTAPIWAAVDGTVINKSTEKPQANATVSLYKLGEAGMESVETVKSDASGKFTMQTEPGQGPYLIQAAFDGVTYNKMLPPGAPRTNVLVEVFNAQTRAGEAKVTQHMLLFEPNEGALLVNENVILENAGKFTFNNPDEGTYRFYLPPEANGKVKIMAAAPNGMPIERAANPTKTENIYAIDFAIKPGETRLQLTYSLPLADPATFTSRILHKEGTTRLVTPRGVSLKAENITELGREPATQAAIYNLNGQEMKLEISGTGSLREAASEGGENEGPGIQEILPRIYDRLNTVLALAALILVSGFVLLYRSSPTGPEPATSAPSKKGKSRA